jgi:DNA-binding GntR family transcriptional regulator
MPARAPDTAAPKSARTAATSARKTALKAVPKEPSPTEVIVDSLTRAIVEHRLIPGEKLAEQKLAAQYGVSRTLVRQALFQMVPKGLIQIELARGAFVAKPSLEEAKQVFAVRRMLEGGLAREFAAQARKAQIDVLRDHMRQEQAAVARQDAAARVELLGDFHVVLARQLGNEVLAKLLDELISRCTLIMLMYQSSHAAQDSANEHAQIVAAFEAKDVNKAAKLMDAHLRHVEDSLRAGDVLAAA